MQKLPESTVINMTKTYEEAFKRLEEITALLEKGGLPLEKTLELFSEGTALLNECSKCLDEAELKIKTLSDNGDINE